MTLPENNYKLRGTSPLPSKPRQTSIHWIAADVAAIRSPDEPPIIGSEDVVRVSDDLDIWDAWPIQDRLGYPVLFEGEDTIWMALGAPRFDDPDQRHGHARIQLLLKRGINWTPLGPAMPEGFSPGSREWSGSAVLDADGEKLTLYFTATGRRGEAEVSFEQRLFEATATLTAKNGQYALQDWRDLKEIVQRHPDFYMASDDGSGTVGTIKAFRDPAYFYDRETSLHHIFFAASQADSASQFNGVVGSAKSGDGKSWAIQSPTFSANGLNNELERPHMIRFDGRYYLFWSTQRHVFDPDGPTGPTGLYGAVTETLGSNEWCLINGTGLIFSNPQSAPRQAYSWLVMPDLSVISFIDDWGAGERTAADRRFGATFSPPLQIWLDGTNAGLVG